jgi:alkylhydroperoxidase/carboxymuconolactone decarboxylase family protein YurZ/ketosteroid isomerase-like protein
MSGGLERIDDLLAIERVLRYYFDRIDAQDATAAVEHFAPHAKAYIMTGKHLEGRDRIGRALGRVLAQYEVTSHHVTNVRVDLTGDDGAVVWSHVYAYHRMAHTGRPWHLWVQLYDRFERIDGRWYIAEHALNGVDSIPPRPDIPAEWYSGHPDHPPTDHLVPWQRRGRASIAAAAPDVAAGMERLREAAFGDGALPGATKALLAAAVAASKGHEELLRACLTRGRDTGLEPDAVWGAAGIVLTSRGDAAGERFAVAAIELFGSPEPVAPSVPADLDAAVSYLTDYYGEIPARFAFLRETSPEAFVGMYLLHRGSLRSAGLDPKVRELVLCAINAADYQPELMAIHAREARGVGASRGELAEAVIATLPVAGLSVWSSAADTLAAIP